ncbi:HEXXH motif-containing putative peptide modification protein [Streptomyces olivoreticuli]|uniref:aKG-HExxH-type peptide beta-hydroxylase n=1 Tax=Streptomyces olivoreticuli TaxID=68246 RepID=UPI00265A40C4|nr:HEXXH motif-containing putative peptide modification protein [Streptomyces olivoreticuli]WKK25918.1 HEXXH motif-containing putative peptide modification protein [Streptomyces olivoreticuli]
MTVRHVEANGVPAPAALARLARTRSAPADLDLLLRGRRSRRLILLKSLLAALDRSAESVPAAVRARFEEHWRLLERAEGHDPAAVHDTLDYPTVGTWLARTLAAPTGIELACRLDHFGSVAAAAALRAGTPFTLTLGPRDGLLALPGIGVLATPAPAVRLTARAHTAHLRPGGRGAGAVLLRTGGRIHGTGPGWRGLRRLPGTTALLDDLDPCRAPPEGIGRAALPPAPRSATGAEPWLRRWRSALALLRAIDPQRAAETTALLRCLVPLARTGPYGQGARGVSATFRAAPGAVLATLPDTAADLAAVLVHETQHGKLAVLHDLLPLHHAGPYAVHRVAWRTDPRPLAGVLQGTYAHLALADFWGRVAGRAGLPPGARSAARARHDSYRRQVAEALPILLESNELTPAGVEFATGMRQHHAGLGRAAGPTEAIDGTSPFGDIR